MYIEQFKRRPLTEADLEPYLDFAKWCEENHSLAKNHLFGEWYQIITYNEWVHHRTFLARTKAGALYAYNKKARLNKYELSPVQFSRILIGRLPEFAEKVCALSQLQWEIQDDVNRFMIWLKQLDSLEKFPTKFFRYCHKCMRKSLRETEGKKPPLAEAYGCESCDYNGINFNGNKEDMLRFWFQTLGANDRKIMKELSRFENIEIYGRKPEQINREQETTVIRYPKNCPVLDPKNGNIYANDRCGDFPNVVLYKDDSELEYAVQKDYDYFFQYLEEELPELQEMKDTLAETQRLKKEKNETFHRSQAERREREDKLMIKLADMALAALSK